MRTRTLPVGTLVAVVVFLVLATLWVVNCSGPRASASDLSVQAPTSDTPAYQLSAVVHNGGPGHVEVQVMFRLRDRDSGRTFEQSQTVSLDAGETSVVSAQIMAPSGNYASEVEVGYPPG